MIHEWIALVLSLIPNFSFSTILQLFSALTPLKAVLPALPPWPAYSERVEAPESFR